MTTNTTPITIEQITSLVELFAEREYSMAWEPEES